MNTKEYIESGILEAYILGALPQEERVEVEANVAMYPELSAELDAIEAIMQQFTAGIAVDPPPALEEKIWGALNGKTTATAGPATAEQPRASRTILFEPQQRKMDWRIAAAVALLIGSLAVNFILYNQGKEAREQTTALNTQMQQLQAKQNELSLAMNDYSKANNMMADTGMQTIVMHTVQPGHPMAATVYWSKTKGDAYVAMNALPQPPKGMQYQLWVIQAGKPVSMGTLPNSMANSAAMQKVNMQVMAGDAFAISLEKEGGNPTPTTVYVLGKA